MGRFSLTRNAREDITEIVAYIATDSVDTAIGVSDRLEGTFTILGDNPNAGRLRPEIGADIRSFPTGQYIVLYRSIDSEVIIVRIVHAVRDLDRLLGEN